MGFCQVPRARLPDAALASPRRSSRSQRHMAHATSYAFGWAKPDYMLTAKKRIVPCYLRYWLGTASHAWVVYFNWIASVQELNCYCGDRGN